jgi:hypothetical protein
VYCQVQGFRYGTKSVNVFRQASVSLSLSQSYRSLLSSPWPSLIILHEIVWKRRNPFLKALPLAVSQDFVISITRYLSSYTHALRDAGSDGGDVDIAYHISHRSIISRGVLKYLRPCNLIKLCQRAKGITLRSPESDSSLPASPGRH